MPRRKVALSEIINELESGNGDMQDTQQVKVKLVADTTDYVIPTENKKIVLRCADDSLVRHNIVTILRPVMDRYGRLLTGQPTFTEEEKRNIIKVVDAETSRKLMGSRVELDLNNPIDAIDWAWMKYHPYIAASKAEANRPEIRYYIEDTEKENEEFIKRKKHEITLSSIIMDLPVTKKRMLARVLGLLSDGVGERELDKFLLEAATKDYTMLPEKQMLTLIRDEQKLKFLYLSNVLLDKGEIKFEFGIYKYNNTVIGGSFEEYVRWLNNPERSSYVALMMSKYVN